MQVHILIMLHITWFLIDLSDFFRVRIQSVTISALLLIGCDEFEVAESFTQWFVTDSLLLKVLEYWMDNIFLNIQVHR